MKKLLFFLLIISARAFGQSESHNFMTYDTAIIYQTDPFHTVTYTCRISRPVNMFTVGNADTASRPAIITMPGQGEMGTDTSKLSTYGPHYWTKNGWNGSVVLGNGTHFPILITMICSYQFPDPLWNLSVLNGLLSRYHIKRNSVHLAGLSQGAFTWAGMICYEATTGGEDGMKPVTSLTLLSGAAVITPPGYPAFGHWARKYNGKLFATVGPADAQAPNVPPVYKAMNDSVNGSAYFSYNTVGGGTHCCWNTEYDPSVTNWQTFAPLGTYITTGTDSNSRGTYKAGSNLFQWMLRQGDTTLVPSAAALTIKDIITMEYQVAFHASNDTLYASLAGSTNPIAYPLPGGRKVKQASPGFNSIYAASTDGMYYISNAYTASSVSFALIPTDTLGSPFNNIIGTFSAGGTYVAIRSDSTAWMGGDDNVKIFHSTGTVNMRPTLLAAGLKFKQISIGALRIVGLTYSGQVYEWLPGGGATAIQKTIPRAAIAVWAGHFDYAGCLIPKTTGSQTMGYPYVWGTSWGDWGDKTPGHTYTQPTDISTLWTTTVPIKEISVSWNTTHTIDSLGVLRGLGYNAQGEVGNDTEIVNRYTYATWNDYGWTFNNFENPVSAPAPIIGTPGTVWDKLYSSTFFTFYKYARAANGDFYAWGRNKSQVLGDGNVQVPDSNAAHPNALDVKKPKKVTPLTTARRVLVYNESVRGAGPNQSITTSNTTVSVTGHPLFMTTGTDTLGYPYVAFLWTQISGPNTATILNATSKSTAINGLINGTYIFQVLTTDANGGLDTARVQVIVNVSGIPPTVSAGTNQTIFLPTTSANLIGSASGNGGATISSVAWTQVSGPNTATITSPATTSTSVTGLIQGIYVFRLTATDSNSNTASNTVQVQILPNPASNCNCLSFPIPTAIK